MLPLEGIRVCDLSIAQFGPHATMMLASLGADVVKVESPGHGDPGRGIALRPDGLSAFFQAHNQNKRSLTVNLRKPAGKNIILRLAARSDVFVQSWTPGTIERLDLGYEQIRDVRSDIIYASASGFGPEGQAADRGAMDMVAQAAGGLAWANSAGPDAEPWPVGATIADQAGSLVLAYGILAALFHRQRTGEGQRVDASLLGSQLTLQAWSIAHYFLSGERPLGGRHGSSSPIFTLYRACDGWFAIAIIDERQWPVLCELVGRPELADDTRFAGREPRQHNRPALTEILDTAFATRSRAEWLSDLERAGIPCGPVNGYADLVEDPQVKANGYLREVEVPGHGPLRLAGAPVAFDRTPAVAPAAAPELGQHTEEVLLELGYGWPEIEQLREEHVIR